MLCQFINLNYIHQKGSEINLRIGTQANLGIFWCIVSLCILLWFVHRSLPLLQCSSLLRQTVSTVQHFTAYANEVQFMCECECISVLDGWMDGCDGFLTPRLPKCTDLLNCNAEFLHFISKDQQAMQNIQLLFFCHI